MAKYEPTYVSQLAEIMMSEAARIVLTRTIVYGALGLVVGYVVGQGYRGGMLSAILLAVIGAALGWVTARGQVLLLRAQAQMMLTQLQIEMNTRPR